MQLHVFHVKQVPLQCGAAMPALALWLPAHLNVAASPQPASAGRECSG
jgi:hypothetical protein